MSDFECKWMHDLDLGRVDPSSSYVDDLLLFGWPDQTSSWMAPEDSIPLLQSYADSGELTTQNKQPGKAQDLGTAISSLQHRLDAQDEVISKLQYE
jgi:hypothetical protein